MGGVTVIETTRYLPSQGVHRLGWSKPELAHFQRAARLLLAEGLSVMTDHGLTDEGEPWFVLCDAESGEIVVHFARIHGSYVACVPFRGGALTGSLLPEVIDRFLRRRHDGRAITNGMRSTPAA
jgi:hypothetical protein